MMHCPDEALGESPESILIPPCGGSLVDLLVTPEAVEDLRAEASRLRSLQLSERSVCDLEMMATGAFSPLDRFMGCQDYRRVLEEMRLDNGCLFPIPVTLPVENPKVIELDKRIALRDPSNRLLGVMTVEEVYEWDLSEVARRVF